MGPPRAARLVLADSLGLCSNPQMLQTPECVCTCVFGVCGCERERERARGRRGEGGREREREDLVVGHYLILSNYQPPRQSPGSDTSIIN